MAKNTIEGKELGAALSLYDKAQELAQTTSLADMDRLQEEALKELREENRSSDKAEEIINTFFDVVRTLKIKTTIL